MIDIDNIEPNRNNFYEISEIESLADDIERQGLMNALVVSEDDGRYELISGHRRLAALKSLIADGRRRSGRVPCFIKGAKPNNEAGSGNVRVSGAGGAGSDGRGTAAPERTDRPLGQGVAEIHDGELSGGDPVAGGSSEMGADSPSDRQGSMGDVGTSAEAVRREESSPENDVHRNRALGENTEFHSGTRGNGADSSSAQRINNTAAEDIFPAVSVFIGLAAGALYENDLVRNAHRNTDRENFDVEVENAATSYYTRLITGREGSEYSAEQLAPLYNRFQRDKDFRAEVISEVADRLDESLTSLEAARSKAAELGIPFSDLPYDSEEDDPYAYDGSMSIADSRKVADASNLRSGDHRRGSQDRRKVGFLHQAHSKIHCRNHPCGYSAGGYAGFH